MERFHIFLVREFLTKSRQKYRWSFFTQNTIINCLFLIIFFRKDENNKCYIMDKMKFCCFKNTHSHQGKQANPKDSEQIHPSVNIFRLKFLKIARALRINVFFYRGLIAQKISLSGLWGTQAKMFMVYIFLKPRFARPYLASRDKGESLSRPYRADALRATAP